MSAPNRILVVDDSPTQLQQLKNLLLDAGFEVDSAPNGSRAMECVIESPPALVVTDLQMPDMNGLQLVEALQKQFPRIPIVLTTSEGSESIASEALQKGATSYVPKRDLDSSLVATVRKVLALVQDHEPDHEDEVASCAVKSVVELVLVNDDSLVPSVISRLEQPIAELGIFDEGEWMQVAMALDEALLNAMIHGNLEVSSDLRQLDDGQPYIDMIAKRKTESPFCDRRVSVRLQASPEEARFTIRDEGPGFDASSVCDPTEPENLEKAGGRGLLLINAFMDEVHHNECGNEIVLVKRKSKPE